MVLYHFGSNVKTIEQDDVDIDDVPHRNVNTDCSVKFGLLPEASVVRLKSQVNPLWGKFNGKGFGWQIGNQKSENKESYRFHCLLIKR